MTCPNRFVMPRSSSSAASGLSPGLGHCAAAASARTVSRLSFVTNVVPVSVAGRHLLALAHADELVHRLLGHLAEVLLAGAVDRPFPDAVHDLRRQVVDDAEHLPDLVLLLDRRRDAGDGGPLPREDDVDLRVRRQHLRSHIGRLRGIGIVERRRDDRDVRGQVLLERVDDRVTDTARLVRDDPDVLLPGALRDVGRDLGALRRIVGAHGEVLLLRRIAGVERRDVHARPSWRDRTASRMPAA